MILGVTLIRTASNTFLPAKSIAAVCSQGDFIDRGERVQVVQITGKTVTVRACGENQ